MKRVSHIVFLGDSFTLGEDSGGDGLHKEEETYPYYLSKLISDTVTYSNLAISGNSNGLMFVQLADYITNHDVSSTLFIVGATIEYRYPTTIEAKKNTIGGTKYDSIFVGLDRMGCPEQQLVVHDMIIEEDQRLHRLNSFASLLAMRNLVSQLNAVGIFIFNMLMDDYDPTCSELFQYIYDSQRRAIDGIPKSKSGHFYGTGYKMLAERIYTRLTSSMEKLES